MSKDNTSPLDIAKSLIAKGVPVFAAPPCFTHDGSRDWKKSGGYQLPSGWQNTPCDPSTLDAWQPGWALCAVMGHTLDAIDIDAHKDGMASFETLNTDVLHAGVTPVAAAATPSGGIHLFIPTLGIHSRDNIAPGIDLKAGVGGKGHGFVFIAPTEKLSKTTGEIRNYGWVIQPDPSAPHPPAPYASALRAHVEALRAPVSQEASPVAGEADPEHVRAYVRAMIDGIREELQTASAWPDGQTDSRGRGWEKVVADAAFRIASAGMTKHSGVDDPQALFFSLVPEAMQITESYTAAEKWRLQSVRATPLIVKGISGFTPEAYGLSAPIVTASKQETTISTDLPEMKKLPEVFNPKAISDQDLADAALAAAEGVYAFEGEEQAWWEFDQELPRWRRSHVKDGAKFARTVLDQLARRAPQGDASAEKGSPAQIQAERRQKLVNDASRGRLSRLMMDRAPQGAFHVSAIDQDHDLLWAGGWCWDLRASIDGPVRADVSPGVIHQHSAVVAPALVPTPRWDAFRAAVFPDEEIREHMIHLMGLATTGRSDRILGMLWGEAMTGKTKFLQLCAKVLGTYALKAESDLLNPMASNPEFKIVHLKGVRMAWVDEGPANNRSGVEHLKALTGGGTLNGALKGRNSFAFQPTHTLFFSDNRVPEVGDAALRSRVRPVNTVGDLAAIEKAVSDILHDETEWLATEGPGVLAQFMMAAARYLRDRHVCDSPESIRAMVEELANDQDPVRNWLRERTSPDDWTNSIELYGDFRSHCEATGVPRSLIPSLHTWGRRLTAEGVPSQKHPQTRKVQRLLSIRGNWGVVENPGLSVAPGGAKPFSEGPDDRTPKVSKGFGESPKVSGFYNEMVTEDNETVTTAPARNLQEEVFRNDRNDPGPEGSKGPDDETPSQGDSRNLRNLRNLLPIEEIKEEEEEENMGNYGKKRSEGPEGPESSATPLAESDEVVENSVKLPAVATPDGNVIPTTIQDACALADTLAGGIVTLDCETTGFPVGHADHRVKTAQIGTSGFAVVLDASDADQAAVATDTLDRAGEIVAHSATADVSLWAEHVGRDAANWWPRVTDTAVVAALADPAVTGLHEAAGALGLKALSRRLVPGALAPEADKARAALFRSHKWLTNPGPDTPASRSGWHQVDPADPVMARYAAADVLDTARLLDVLPRPSAELLTRERAVQGITARLPERGIQLDADAVRRLTRHHEDARDQAAAALRAHGIDSPGSTAQVGAAFQAAGAELPTTETGRPSTTAHTVERLAEAAGPAAALARDILEWRHHDKALSAFLAPFSQVCEHGDGRVRPTILTLGAAATGRMSSVRPNIQQIPRDGGMRGLFLADPGHAFIAADFSSVEVRIAAALTQDATLCQMVRDGVDLHGEVVKLAWGLQPDHPEFKSARYSAKRAVFGYLYGAGLATMRRQLESHADKAEAVVSALRALTPQLVTWERELRNHVKSGAMRYWTHPSGRRAYFNSAQPHKAFNMIVQGFGRELLVDALLRWEGMHPGCTVIPIHDELVIHVPADKADEWVNDLSTCMTTQLDAGAAGIVPIVSEADAPSARWGSLDM